MIKASDTSITIMGGGSGTSVLLTEFKKITSKITAIVNMSDDGGSTGKLRDEFDASPPGDVRQCLVALGNKTNIKDLFNYRFSKGNLEGHCVGNIILTSLELQYKDFNKAIDVAAEMLEVSGNVIPVTLDKHTLLMHDGSETIRGQYLVAHRPIKNKNVYLDLDPMPSINPRAKQAIVQSDLIIIAPGSLYGSLLPALATQGIKEAIRKSKAKIIMVCNLVTTPGQTDNWHVIDYVKEIEKYIGKDQVDFVLFNTNTPSIEFLKKYAGPKELPVSNETSRFKESNTFAIGRDLLGKPLKTQRNIKKDIKRNAIRHDANKTCQEIMKMFNLRD